MADDVTPGELDRRLRDHEVRTDRIHGEQDSRITRVAADAVSTAVYRADQRARDREVQELRDEIKDLRDLRGMTFGRWMAVLSVVAAFLGLLLTAYAMSRGAK